MIEPTQSNHATLLSSRAVDVLPSDIEMGFKEDVGCALQVFINVHCYCYFRDKFFLIYYVKYSGGI